MATKKKKTGKRKPSVVKLERGDRKFMVTRKPKSKQVTQSQRALYANNMGLNGWQLLSLYVEGKNWVYIFPQTAR
jgi:hypothetical protein